MTLKARGWEMRCDGDGCGTVAYTTVPDSEGAAKQQVPRSENWMAIGDQHYCPACAARLLKGAAVVADIAEKGRRMIADLANKSIALKGTSGISFDQLAEEVLELHLALRRKHPDPPALEWLEIASLAVSALRILLIEDVEDAYCLWLERHWGGKEE